jgi:hypothetical protein
MNSRFYMTPHGFIPVLISVKPNIIAKQASESCGISGCKENHPIHFCEICNTDNSNHLREKCPLIQEIQSDSSSFPKPVSSMGSNSNSGSVSNHVHFHYHAASAAATEFKRTPYDFNRRCG